jgi:pilus assembly protein Flp/PilA
MFARVRRARRYHEDEGASAVEYALLVAAIAALIVVVVFAFGHLVQDIFSDTCNAIDNSSTSSTSGDCSGGSSNSGG